MPQDTHRTDGETVLQNLQEGVLVVDTEYTVTYANARMAETLGVSRDELVGHQLGGMAEFVVAGFDEFRAAVEEVLRAEAAERRVELETIHPDAAPVPPQPAIEARISPFTSEDGHTGALVALRDISARKEAETNLREREKRLRTMFEAHSAPMLLIEPESGDITDANQAAVEFYGYDRNALTELTIDDINCHSAEEVAREREQARAENRNHFVFQHELASGEVRTVEVYSVPVQFGDQELLFSIIHDITQRKEYEHELQLFRKAVEHAGHAVIITDVNGVIEYVNPRFETQTGYDRAEAIGKTPRILRSGKQDDSFYEELWEAILAGETWESDLINQRKSGELYYAQQTIAPITSDGTITNFVAIQTDITNRKLSEKWLSELNRVLRHNVRNSLTAIVGHAEVLADRVDDSQQSRIERILDQANSLAETSEKSSLIRQHLANESSTTTATDIASLVERLVTEFEDDYPEATIRTDLEPATVEIGTTMFRAVLTELVDNAVRHNDRDSPTVTISSENADRPATHARLQVADNGPGIPEQELSAVDIGVAEQLTHGSGLGLAHIHWVVTDCGGELTIADNEPRGTVVTLSLPGAE